MHVAQDKRSITVISTDDEYAGDNSRGEQLWYIVGVSRAFLYSRPNEKQSGGFTMQTSVNGNFPRTNQGQRGSCIVGLQRGCIVGKERKRERGRREQRGNWLRTAFNKGTRAEFSVRLYGLSPIVPDLRADSFSSPKLCNLRNDHFSAIRTTTIFHLVSLR